MTNRNELERLLAAATSGPWAVRTINGSIGGIDTGCGEFSVAQVSIVDHRQPGIRNLTDALSRRQANAALIVWLRNNAPHYLSLMDEVERLREALGRIAKHEPCHCMSCTHMGEMARQALGETHDN